MRFLTTSLLVLGALTLVLGLSQSVQAAPESRCGYQPSYCQPSYCQPSYCQPSYCQPSYCQPSYCQPSYCQPSYCQPSYCQPSYCQPSYCQPSYCQPSYCQPYCGNTGYTGIGYGCGSCYQDSCYTYGHGAHHGR